MHPQAWRGKSSILGRIFLFETLLPGARKWETLASSFPDCLPDAFSPAGCFPDLLHHLNQIAAFCPSGTLTGSPMPFASGLSRFRRNEKTGSLLRAYSPQHNPLIAGSIMYVCQVNLPTIARPAVSRAVSECWLAAQRDDHGRIAFSLQIEPGFHNLHVFSPCRAFAGQRFLRPGPLQLWPFRTRLI